MTGTFQGSSITFGSYTLYNVGTGALDVFVAKYDASGNVLVADTNNGRIEDFSPTGAFYNIIGTPVKTRYR